MVSQTPLAGSTSLKAVIFDVDGTLVDSNDLHIEAWREAFAHYGIGLTYDRQQTPATAMREKMIKPE